MGLDSIYDADWSLGIYRSGAEQLEPEGSAQTIVGLVGDDGLPYRRGGASYKSNAAFGAAGLRMLWSGRLPVGTRTLFGSASDLGWLSSDDATPLTNASSYLGGLANSTRAVQQGSAVFFLKPGIGSDIGFYGGSYRTGGTVLAGTVNATAGSGTVTGVGTSFTTQADPGSLLYIGPAGTGHYGVVLSVESNTSLTLADPWGFPTIAGAAANTSPVTNTEYGVTKAPTPGDPVGLAAVAGRLVIAFGQFLLFTPVGYPWAAPAADDYHAFPAPLIGVGATRDTALTFTEAGVYAVSNMAYDLTDAAGNPQQRVELINADLIAWGHEGIAPWKGALVVPALDGVWLMDIASAPTRISDRISDLYLSYVRTSGYKPGVAEVFNGEYFLPVLNSSNGWVDTLVCRLEPAHNGNTFAWSQLSGFGAQVTAFAERSSSPPVLLGASTAASSRVLNCTSYFTPTAAVKQDADGSTHGFQLVTRNIATGGNVKNAVDYIKVKYLLTADTGDSPTMTMEANPDGEGWTTLALGGGTPTAGVSDGYEEIYWSVGMAARFIRFRLTLASDDAIQVQPKSIQVFVFKSGAY